jgi:hypothetical protein
MLGESFQDTGLPWSEEMKLRDRIKDLEAALKNRSTKAFPHNYERLDHPAFVQSEGMNLRDYFAAKAMQTLVSKYGNQGDYEKCAEEAFNFADALMKARK